MASRMRSSFSAAPLPRTRAVVASAPALTIGLNGRLWRSSKTMELKASPLGSTPTWRSTSWRPWSSSASPKVKTLEIDCRANGTS